MKYLLTAYRNVYEPIENDLCTFTDIEKLLLAAKGIVRKQQAISDYISVHVYTVDDYDNRQYCKELTLDINQNRIKPVFPFTNK